jgi:hypothetical protein
MANMKMGNGRRPYSVRERVLAEVILGQMELMRRPQRKPMGVQWETWLKNFLFAAGFLVVGIGLGRLFGAQ